MCFRKEDREARRQRGKHTESERSRQRQAHKEREVGRLGIRQADIG